MRKSQGLPHDAPGWPQNRPTPARILSDPGATRNRVRVQGVPTLGPASMGSAPYLLREHVGLVRDGLV